MFLSYTTTSFAFRLSFVCLSFILLCLNLLGFVKIIFILNIVLFTSILVVVLAIYVCISVRYTSGKAFLLQLYTDCKLLGLATEDAWFDPSIPYKERMYGEKKLSLQLRSLRENITSNYVTYWWEWMSTNKHFENVVRERLTVVLERLVANVRRVDYSRVLLSLIGAKLWFSTNSEVVVNKKAIDLSMKKYLKDAVPHIVAYLLPDTDKDFYSLHNFLTEVLTTSIFLPFLKLVESPKIIFNSVIYILIGESETVESYINKVNLQHKNDVYLSASLLKSKTALLSSKTTKEDRTNGCTFEQQSKASSSVNLAEENSETYVGFIKALTISSTHTATESRSEKFFTLYGIRFLYLVYNEKNQLVWKKGTVKRRFREFIALHGALLGMTEYRGIRGPSTLDQLTLSSLSDAKITERREFLEVYMQQIVKRVLLSKSHVLQQFFGIVGNSSAEFFVPNLTIHSKLRRGLTGIFDKITDVLPNNIFAAKEGDDCTKVKRTISSHTLNTSEDDTDDVSRTLTSFSKLGLHQNPLFLNVNPNSSVCQTLLQANREYIGDQYLLLWQHFCHEKSGLRGCSDESLRPIKIAKATDLGALPKRDAAVPFLLAFRELALHYREKSAKKWPLDGGPFLVRRKGIVAMFEKAVWRLLGCVADHSIQWNFENLLRPGYVADYLASIQGLLWDVDGEASKAFYLDGNLEDLRLAACQSIADAIPDIAYLFVRKIDLVYLLDGMFKEFEDPEMNRILLVQILQILLEQYIFPEVFSQS